MKRILTTLGALALCCFFAGNARADYVCGTNFFPGSGSHGTLGFVAFQTYVGPNCTGAFIGSYFLCSSSATSTDCSSSTTFRAQNTDAVASIENALRFAAMYDTPVVVSTGPCNGGGASCGADVGYQ